MQEYSSSKTTLPSYRHDREPDHHMVPLVRSSKLLVVSFDSVLLYVLCCCMCCVVVCAVVVCALVAVATRFLLLLLPLPSSRTQQPTTKLRGKPLPARHGPGFWRAELHCYRVEPPGPVQESDWTCEYLRNCRARMNMRGGTVETTDPAKWWETSAWNSSSCGSTCRAIHVLKSSFRTEKYIEDKQSLRRCVRMNKWVCARTVRPPQPSRAVVGDPRRLETATMGDATRVP